MNVWDYVVQYQWLISLLLAIVAILQTWRIWFVTKKDNVQKRLVLFFRTISELNCNDLPYAINVDFDGEKYKNIKIIECIFGNSGNVPITESEMIQPLQIEFNKPSKFLDYRVIEKTSNFELSFIKHLTDGKEKIRILFDVLDVKDAIKFYLILSPPEPNLKLELKGKIKDVPNPDQIRSADVTNYRPEVRSGIELQEVLIAILAFFAAAYFSFIYAQKVFFKMFKDGLNFSLPSSEILSLVFGLVPPILILVLLFFLAKRIIRNLNSTPLTTVSLTKLGLDFDFIKK